MTMEAPPAPAPGRRGDADPRQYVRLLVTFVVGFSLPVLACYGLVVVAAVALQILSAGAGGPSFGAEGAGVGPAVAVIRLEGVIVSGKPGPFDAAGVAFADPIVRDIKRAGDDGDVKALIVAVNSPGGGVVASDEIYHALKGSGKPVVVVIRDLGASGAYYVSMASSWIVANPNSLVGSIGVISEFPNAEGLLEKVGVDFVVITSGPRKDFGSPYREMTSKERDYWQAIVDETYLGFVDVVAQGRGMTADDVKPLAEGGVYTGRQALELGLIDQLGYEEDAIAKAAELGGITGKPRIVEYRRAPTLFDLLSMALTRPSLIPSAAELMNLLGHPSLSTRWIGP